MLLINVLDCSLQIALTTPREIYDAYRVFQMFNSFTKVSFFVIFPSLSVSTIDHFHGSYLGCSYTFYFTLLHGASTKSWFILLLLLAYLAFKCGATVMESRQTASRPKGPDNSFKKCPAAPPAPATPWAGSATAWCHMN